MLQASIYLSFNFIEIKKGEVEQEQVNNIQQMLKTSEVQQCSVKCCHTGLVFCSTISCNVSSNTKLPVDACL